MYAELFVYGHFRHVTRASLPMLVHDLSQHRSKAEAARSWRLHFGRILQSSRPRTAFSSLALISTATFSSKSPQMARHSLPMALASQSKSGHRLPFAGTGSSRRNTEWSQKLSLL